MARYTAAEVEAIIAGLDAMNIAALRTFWRGKFGRQPLFRSGNLMRRTIAWKLQEQLYGGLDAETQKQLRAARPPGRRRSGVAAGARLSREWKGVRHEVEVLERGFRYAGADYRSLSQIARLIAGTRWNGPRFFGLSPARSATAAKRAAKMVQSP
jgi:hypothetical protein